MMHHLAARFLTGREEVMNDLVGVDDMRSQVPQDPGHQALAAGDPAGESYDEHASLSKK
jgi:hypothetical protein